MDPGLVGELMAAFGASVVLGFSIGIVPGPVMLLALGQVLQRGWVAWAWIQASTVLAWGLLAMAILAGYAPLLALPGVRPAIALGGGVVLFVLAGSLWRTAGRRAPALLLEAVAKPTTPTASGAGRTGALMGPFIQGFGASFVNPAAAVFWLTVGATLLFQGQTTAGLAGAALVFAGIAVGQMAANGLLVGGFVRASRRFGATAYRRILIGLAVLIALFAIRMVVEAWQAA